MNGLILGMLIDADCLQNFLHFGHDLFIFLILAQFWLHEMGKIWHYLENAWNEWPQIWHADVSWPTSDLISFWSQFVEFPNFGWVWGWQALSWGCMEVYLACWFILITFMTDWVSFGQAQLIVRRAGLLWWQQDFEWRWSVPLFKCLTVLEFYFILFDLCLLITFFNFIMNYVRIVTFWIFTYHKIWILSIMFCFIWSYWIIYFLACLEVSWRVVS